MRVFGGEETTPTSIAPRRRGPSVAFVGTLLGIVASLVVSPPLMLTRSGVVLWLLSWTACGGLAGMAVGFVAARVRKSYALGYERRLAEPHKLRSELIREGIADADHDRSHV
jgi:hypothetical protein